MKTIAAALTSAILLGCAPASATEIDLSAWTCKQFQAASKGDVDIILAWLDGYYRAEDDPPVIDRDQLAANARKLAAFCSTHPDVKLITADRVRERVKTRPQNAAFCKVPALNIAAFAFRYV